MSILIDKNTRVMVQGITGRAGLYHTRRMVAYGTNVVAGVVPGRGGSEVDGIPVYDSVQEAAEAQHPDAPILVVPPLYTRDGLTEALASGIRLIVPIAEGVPILDMQRIYHLNRAFPASRIIGPNSFGVISPGKSKIGFMEDRIFSPGPVGLMSRSASNSYEAVNALTAAGLGQSTCVGIGGDVIPGSTFADLLPLFEEDEETKVIVLIGEIGGYDEEEAAERIRSEVSKPVVAYVAGKNAPVGKKMGHAGAIIDSSGAGSAEAKLASLEAAGAHIAGSLAEIAEIVRRLL